jgi:hypothetical protein
MANQDHLCLIRSGVRHWNEWQNGHPQVRADFANADLRGVDMTRAQLIGADFHRADLPRAHLVRTNLPGATLTQARAERANFERANLKHANLNWVDLSGANLSHANLQNVKLRESVLRAVNLTGAKLVDTDMTGSTVGSTQFNDTDLSKVAGLEHLVHLGPSSIGVDTLYRSPTIPKEFLRRVGIPEVLITYLPSLVERPIEFYSCFISYSRKDAIFARRLCSGLQKIGIRCWLDEHELLPGAKIYTQVDRAIRFSDKVLLCCSKEALTSWWVNSEIESAFAKEQQIMKESSEEAVVLIPLNLDGYLFEDHCTNGKAIQIKTRMAADFQNWHKDDLKFQDGMNSLKRALRVGIKKNPTP